MNVFELLHVGREGRPEYRPLWLVSQPHFEGAMKYRAIATSLASPQAPPDRVELIGAGSLGYGTGPSFG